MEPLTAVGMALSFFVAIVLFTAYSLKMAAKMGSEAMSRTAVNEPENKEKGYIEGDEDPDVDDKS